ncbi:MAG: heat-inducible transcription repressor HrcA [Clostridiales bacterium]|nr:heat-inducible transcription repressor HrcA [Clostridiales bacterium]
MELGERKLKILTAAIEMYIRTGEPVGSKALASCLDHAVSSATIRNEMAELSAMGYLEQPHTSAGRIPTAQAFRLYIDRLMHRHPLSNEDRQAIDQLLSTFAGDPDKLVGEASQALAASTGCAAVTTTPSLQSSGIRRIEVLRVSPRAAALLLMTGSGALRSRVCRFDADVDEQLIERLSNALAANFTGKPPADIGLPQVQRLMVSLGEDGLRCASALTAFYELAQESAEADVLLSGQLNLLRHPDYELARARELLSFLSRREQLIRMFSASPGGLHVLLGSESPRPELDGSSIILTSYHLGDQAEGSIGLIGPLRMDYAAAIPRLEYFAQAVGRLLSELLGEDG